MTDLKYWKNLVPSEAEGRKPSVIHDFLDDEEKMADFMKLSKEEFLKTYSYLSEEEYDATVKAKAIAEMKKALETIKKVKIEINVGYDALANNDYWNGDNDDFNDLCYLYETLLRELNDFHPEDYF